MWLRAFYEATAADGEYLAYGISSLDDALFVGVGCPNGVSLDELYDDSVVGNGEEVLTEGFAVKALLPDAPEHPVEAEGGEVGTDVLLVLCLLVTLCSIATCGCKDIPLDVEVLGGAEAPFAQEVEVLGGLPRVSEDGVGEARGHVAEV